MRLSVHGRVEDLAVRESDLSRQIFIFDIISSNSHRKYKAKSDLHNSVEKENSNK
jgi:hypothetical protein